MKKLSLLLVALFLLCGSLNLRTYAADVTATNEKVLFFADFKDSATPEEAGISTTDWGGATLPSNFSMSVADGKLKIKRESTSDKTYAFEFLSKEELAQVGKLKVEYDISSALGGINTAGTDYSFGIEACKSAKNSYYAFQMCGKTFEMVFSSMKVNGNWSRAKKTYRYDFTTKLEGVSAGLNQVHHVELIFDFDQRTVDYSIDGVVAKDPAPLPEDDSGVALEVYGKAYDLTIDNLKATQLSARGEVRYAGYQMSAVYGNSEESSGMYNIRFVAFGSDMTAEKVGFLVKAVNFEGKEWNLSSTTVYTSILAMSSDGQTLKEEKASDYHAEYLSALTIKGVPAKTAVTFEVTPYTVKADSSIAYGTGYRVAIAENGTVTQTQIGG